MNIFKVYYKKIYGNIIITYRKIYCINIYFYKINIVINNF